MGNRFGRLLDEETDTQALLTRVLGVTLLLSLLAVVGFTLVPAGTGAAYTEFYVLGPDGQASGYPENVSTGETVNLRVGIGNQENQQLQYTVVVRTNETTFVTRSVSVNAGAEWEEAISFAFDSPGSKQLRLELYRGDAGGEPYRSLRLFIEVSSR